MKWNKNDTYRLFFLVIRANLKFIYIIMLGIIFFSIAIGIQPDNQEFKTELLQTIPNFIFQAILYFQVIVNPILTVLYTIKIIAQKRALEQQPEDEESTTNNNQ